MNKVEIKIYRFTGKQLFFTIPEFVCHECDIVIRLVDKIVEKIESESISVQVYPWINNILSSLKKGGWHPPVIMINDKVFSQGIVPDEQKLEREILEEIQKLKI
ncbi:MAG: hypothetical protein IIB02_07905 [Thaumarchaeota archaeon]|nr:hypothetical protein [Nitrososphaerota archaeon]